MLLLAPALTQPMIAIAIVVFVAALWLAWKDVAYPLALAGIPTLINAVVGTNPLPKGGATFLVGAWIGLAVLMSAMRGERSLAAGALWSAPVALAVLLLGLMVFRLSASADEAYGSTKVQLYIADNLLFLVGAVFVGARRSSLRLFLGLTLVILSAGAVLLLGKLLGGGAQQQFSGRFAISAQQGAINLGRDSSNGALIAIAVILIANRLWVRMAAIAVLPVLLVSLLAAGSRGPVLAFVAGLIVLIALVAASGRARRQLAIVGAVLLAAAIIVPLVVPGSSIGRSLSTIVGSAGGLSSNGRSGLWALAFSTFGSHPLLGIGTGGFAALNPETFPHNLLLEMAVEVGIIGLVAVASMIVIMGRRLLLAWRHTTGTERLEVTLVFALFVSAIVNALFSGAIQDNTDVWLWGGLGLGIYARHRRALRRVPIAPGSRSPCRSDAEMLVIRHPETRPHERAYVLDVVLGEFLGLQWRAEPRDPGPVEITWSQDADARTLTVADALLATPADAWLTPRSMPLVPLARWRPQEIGLAPRLVSPEVPVIFGAELEGGGFGRAADDGIELGVDLFGGILFRADPLRGDRPARIRRARPLPRGGDAGPPRGLPDAPARRRVRRDPARRAVPAVAVAADRSLRVRGPGQPRRGLARPAGGVAAACGQSDRR